MTSFQATCPVCGDIGLSKTDIVLVVYRDARDRSHYSFRCPSCFEQILKCADDAVIGVLTATGVRVELTDIPVERLDSHGVRPPITIDDVLDFINLLSESDAVVTFCGGQV